MNTRPLQGWRHMGLVSRIVSTSLVLLLLVQVAGFVLVRTFIADNARERLNHELAVGERVWARLLDQNVDKLLLGASVLAADYAFRDAISTGDVETVRSALDNHGARIGARVAAYFDAERSLVAFVEQASGTLSEEALNAMAAGFRNTDQKGRVMRVGTVPFQFVMVPIKAPVVVGWVLMGFPLDQRLAEDVHGLIDTHLLIQVQHPGGTEGQPLTSTAVSTLTGLSAPLTSPPEAGGGWDMAGQRMVAKAVRTEGWDPGIRVWLLRSEDEVVAPFVRLQGLLLTVTVVGLLLFAAGSTVNARWVTRPLSDLLTSTRRLESGDFNTPVPAPDRHASNVHGHRGDTRVSAGCSPDRRRRPQVWP